MNIGISHFRQPTDHYCVPACLKMMLDYTCKHFNVRCKSLSVKTIAKATKTNRDGTAPKDVENINFLLHRAKPPIKFQLHETAKFQDIVAELDQERPVVCLINIADSPDTIWHAVVVISVSKENIVTYDDPDENEQDCIKTLDAGVFVKKWGFQARLVKVLIGTKGQTYIDGEWDSQGVSE